MKTRYFYEGHEISHIEFISIMRNAGLQSGYQESHYNHLKKLAEKGNEKAQALLMKISIQ